MLQLFFLSIACNLIAGSILASDGISRRIKGFAAVEDLLSSRRAKLILGPSVLIVGFLVLFVPAASGPLMIGDLIPSMVGMAMGIALLFEVFKQDALFPAESSVKQVFAYRTTLGLLGIGVAVLHFFLGERPFL
jgi:hypothetical protein